MVFGSQTEDKKMFTFILTKLLLSQKTDRNLTRISTIQCNEDHFSEFSTSGVLLYKLFNIVAKAFRLTFHVDQVHRQYFDVVKRKKDPGCLKCK